MKSLPGLAVSRSSGIRKSARYESVAAEYYNEQHHPTCADFREASRVYLKRVFEFERPAGRLADVGCGQSLISEFASDDLVLIDESPAMLDLNLDHREKRRFNVVESPFGNSEFDWIFAVLADPYNEIGAWLNIAKALRPEGQCVFIVPSYCWASKFRASSKNEITGKARFDLLSGESLFLPSTILLPEKQKTLISSSGLHVDRIDHVYVSDLAGIRSEKISSVLMEDEALLDIYRARN
jgi:SAM-dependent methyltransferase